jgi:hypothetical protein
LWVILSEPKGLLRLYDKDILKIMKDFLPKDGYCIFGITMEDLYEFFSKNEKNDQMILGRGRYSRDLNLDHPLRSGDRVGVVSLLRFDPKLQKRMEICKKSKKPEDVNLKYSKEENMKWIFNACKVQIEG